MVYYCKNNPQTIQAMFNSIAKRYDLTNAVLSFRLHRKWNHELVKQVMQTEDPHHLLDLCCGTGDIAFDYLSSSQVPCHAHLVDFCSGMLACAKEKSSKLPLQNHQLTFLEADAQMLPFADESMHCTTIAYGIRNIKDPIRCIKEVFRVLKPNGCFGILELTQPKNTLLRLGHRLYLKTMLPLLGHWLTDNPEAYYYLCNSIHGFIAPRELEKILHSVGFVRTYQKPLIGGVATILVGYKPG